MSLPTLPTARGNTYMAGLNGAVLKHRTPGRPRAHPRMTAARARAQLLRRRRMPRLDRPQLHARHAHMPRDIEYGERLRRHIRGHLNAGGRQSGKTAFARAVDDPTPTQRAYFQKIIHSMARDLPLHKWGHWDRLNALADHLEVPRPTRRGYLNPGDIL